MAAQSFPAFVTPVAVAAFLMAAPATTQAQVFANVPEASDYTLIYTLPIPNSANYSGANSVPYTVHNTGQITGYDRVAYYLELDTGSGPQFVYASMDDFAQGRVSSLGLPHNVDNPVFHQTIVSNMNVVASGGAGVTTGTGIATGNVEMWNTNYGPANGIGIPGASATVWDFGDDRSTGGNYGSFQVHNHGAGETLLAYNRWGGVSGTSDLGIGNAASGNPDYTLGAGEASLYTVKNLQVLVRETSDTSNAFANIPEARNYELIHDLDIPNGAAHNSNAIPYKLDRSADVPLGSFGRVAYYMELDGDYAWVSMDAFTNDAGEIGVPARNTTNGAFSSAAGSHQLIANNANVVSNVAGVTNGEGLSTVNLEFWSTNYGGTQTALIPGGTNSFDYDDTKSPGSDYGSMQIHNHEAGTPHTVFAYNRWGSNAAGNSDLGIGNRPATSNTDWTFAQNANTYASKQLQTLVLPRVYDNVAEASAYQIAYALDIPRDQNTAFNTNALPYWIDRAESFNTGVGLDRVAYYMELKTPTGELEWVYVSMDAFTDDATLLGVPSDSEGLGPIWDQAVDNVNVFSNVGSLLSVAGEGLSGSIEFWPDNYGTGLNGVYDYDDNIALTSGGYGSMQVHLPGVMQTLFAYNGWGSTGQIGNVGIGNNTATTHPDWTFNNNAAGYEIANLFVLVLPAPEPSRALLVLLGLLPLVLRRRR